MTKLLNVAVIAAIIAATAAFAADNRIHPGEEFDGVDDSRIRPGHEFDGTVPLKPGHELAETDIEWVEVFRDRKSFFNGVDWLCPRERADAVNDRSKKSHVVPGIFPGDGMRICIAIAEKYISHPYLPVVWEKDGERAIDVPGWRVVLSGTGCCSDPEKWTEGRGWIVALVYNESNPELAFYDKMHVEVIRK